MTSFPGEQAPPKKRYELSNLALRILTGAIVLPVVLLCAVWGGWWFTGLVSLLMSVGVMEFCALGRSRGVEGNAPVGVAVAVGVIVGFHLQNPALWLGAPLLGAVLLFVLELARRGDARRAATVVLATLGAVLYIGFPSGMLVATRNLPDGLTWLMLIFAMTWATDSFAYIGGRVWGRTKLAPSISPKKTLEGAVVGVIGGVIAGGIVLGSGGKFSAVALAPVAAGPLLAIIGDLVESGLKRGFGVKDSHVMGFDILPGHGGVLDRVDGLVLVATMTYLYIRISGLA